ncbi:hypothetical protein AcV5_002825 [Taiwanofungus camphoratus]|nr:hypothetical protein AcV5_002825 [Antrodia cinnamomea]
MRGVGLSRTSFPLVSRKFCEVCFDVTDSRDAPVLSKLSESRHQVSGHHRSFCCSIEHSAESMLLPDARGSTSDLSTSGCTHRSTAKLPSRRISLRGQVHRGGDDHKTGSAGHRPRPPSTGSGAGE